MAFTVDSCCCCFSLKTGTLIISIVQGLLGLSLMVTESVNAYHVEDTTTDERKGSINTPSPPNEAHVVERRIYHITLAISGGFNIMLSVLLFICADKKNPKMAKTWLILMTGLAIFMFLFLVVYAIYMAINKEIGAAILSVLRSMVYSIPAIVLTAYSILVVYSLQKKAEESSSGEKPV
ncbi:uncharacterized protein [Anabrus simplex]|uniref:uncharacterized protein n=1 Tax=Anabrus simplex TaxID=316456 RepID=UPI0034DDAB89